MSALPLSVIMPVYNAERYLRQAVDSILDQTFRDFEFLIVNDGSTDRSLEILESCARQDSRIHLISRPNTGYVVALNELLSLARGEFIARMDADDVSMPDRFARQLEFLRRFPDYCALGSRVLIIDDEGDPLRLLNDECEHEQIDRLHLQGHRGAVICHPVAMIRRRVMEQVGGYRVEFETAEDLDLFLRLAELGRLANVPQVLLKYRQHRNSVCHSRRQQQVRAIRAAIRDAKLRRGCVVDPEQHEVEPLGIGGGLQLRSKWAWWALSAGYVGTARKHALAVFRAQPFARSSWTLLACALRGH